MHWVLLSHPAITDAEGEEVPKVLVVKKSGAELTADEVTEFVIAGARHLQLTIKCPDGTFVAVSGTRRLMGVAGHR